MNSSENTQPLPEDSPAPAEKASTAENTETAETVAPKTRRRRNLLIGLGAAVAVIAMGAGAYAVGSAVADDDHRGVQSAAGGSTPGDDDHGDRDDDDHGAGASDAPFAASDTAALRTAAEQAIAHAGGEGVTSIEVERGGYDIDVRLSDGREADVFVSTDGTARTRDDDDDDVDDDPVLDLARLGDILAAARTAAASQAGSEGELDSISTHDGRARVYEVELRLEDRREIEIELADDLTVVAVDIDR